MKSGDGDSPNEVCHCACCLTGTRRNTKGLWKSVQRHMKRWLISRWGSWVVVVPGLESPLLLRPSGAKLWNKRVVIEWLAERGRAQRLAVKPLKALSAYELFFFFFLFFLPLLLLAALLSFVYPFPSPLFVCPSPSNMPLHFGTSSLFRSSRLFPLMSFLLSTFSPFPHSLFFSPSFSSFYWDHLSVSTMIEPTHSNTKHFIFFSLRTLA